MSRSYKHHPFMAVTGGGSAKQDKVQAHRGERRAVQRAIHNARKQDFDNFIDPHRRECHHNNTYDWGRDGKQTYQGLDARDWNRYIRATLLLDDWAVMRRHYVSCFSQWPPQWYVKMMRK